jgi:hypothetical protein
MLTPVDALDGWTSKHMRSLLLRRQRGGDAVA